MTDTRSRTTVFITLSLKVYRESWEDPIIVLCRKLCPELLVIRKEFGTSGEHPHLHILMHKHKSVRTDKLKERFNKVISLQDRESNPKWWHLARVPSVRDKLSYLKKIDMKARYICVDGVNVWDNVPDYVENINRMLLDRAYKSMSVTLNRKNFCFFVAEYIKYNDIQIRHGFAYEDFHEVMVRMAEDKINFSEMITLGTLDGPYGMERRADSFDNLYYKYYEYVELLL